MPSVTVDIKSLSSSLYSSEDTCSSTEMQGGFCKSHNQPNCFDSDQGTKPSLNVQPASNFSESSKVNDERSLFLGSLSELFSRSYGTSNQSLTLCHVDSDQGTKPSSNVQPASNFSESCKVNDESSLFSSSLSELLSRRLRISANNALYGHSVDSVASHYEEERPFDSLEELEAQTIGNLLPKDDDLLSGLTDGLDHIIQDSAGDDVDEQDLFNNVGGMDLGDDDTSSSGQKNSEFLDGACNGQLELCNASSAGEHPSRTLFVTNISSDVEDSELKAHFEQFGDIHTLYTDCKHRGFVMISYYDIRPAQNAMRAHQNRLFSSFRKFDIHSSIPKDNPCKEDINQGTLAVSIHDSSVSNNELHHIFNVYGEIKEIHENPRRRHHKLIEFYDVRAAEAALHALNCNATMGKRLKVEPSQPGHSKSMFQLIHPELEQKECNLYYSHPLKSPARFPGLHGVIKSGSTDGGRVLSAEPAKLAPSLETSIHRVSSSVPNTLPSLVSVRSVGNHCEVTKSSSPGQLNFDHQAASAFHPNSLPEFHDGVLHNPPEVAANINLKTQERIDNVQFGQVYSNGHSMKFNDFVLKSSGNGSCPLVGHHYKWSNSYQPFGMMWPNSPSYFDGTCASPTLPRLHGLPRSPSHMMSPFLSINDQHVPSATAVNSPLWDRRHSYGGESPEASAFHPGSVGNRPFYSNTAHCVDFVSQSNFPHFGGNCVELQFHNQRGLMFPGRNHMLPMINSFGTHKGRARSRRNDGGSNLADNKQYELDIDCIKKGEDSRTTLMIKNIPNKYTSKMLLAAIDERHKGTYDFVYLPIDFKNKCNVGYAFINMTDPSLIIPLYQVFNGKKWEKFNSEKVASLAYARIQGKAALIAHFQNSSLMNEDKRCRPILFNTDGPNAGDQVPFPVGDNVRSKPGRVRSNTQEEKLHGNMPYMGNSKLSSGGDLISKESD